MEIVDLTHPLTPGIPVVPGDPPVTQTRVHSHDPDGYQVTAICLGSHSGTHLDAPRHLFPNGATLDAYPAGRLVGAGWVIDVRPQQASQPLAAALPPRLPEPGKQRLHAPPRIERTFLAERLQGVQLETGDFLLLWTGGALLADDAVAALLRSGAGLVGTDAPSLDDDPYPAHRALLGAGVLLAENLANLDKLGPGRVTCAFLPLALAEADGAPVRAVAWR